jgi:hypothetical protein
MSEAKSGAALTPSGEPRREIAKPYPFYARKIASIALANFAGLPCNENF